MYSIDDPNVVSIDFCGTKLWPEEEKRDLCSLDFPFLSSPFLPSFSLFREVIL